MKSNIVDFRAITKENELSIKGNIITHMSTIKII